ncbi:hypothetical protein [Aquimarina longa]|uniref:hypothetical protein n=1 Tax=Aquimarina longa TaxID=1080221 RepID=UPI000780B685|nr:hypothetical protein [Aquimarina longa]
MKNFIKISIASFLIVFINSCDIGDEENLRNDTTKIEYVNIIGKNKEGERLTVEYLLQKKTNVSFQWYISDRLKGTKSKKIIGATKRSYVLKSTDVEKYIAVLLFVKNMPNSARRSKFVGPIVKK